jgi:hypothetical protein
MRVGFVPGTSQKRVELLPGTILRYRPVYLVCTEIRSAAGEIIVHSRKTYAGVDGLRTCSKPEVEISRLV